MCNEVCYLDDSLDGNGGADLAAKVRFRSGWLKFQELVISNILSSPVRDEGSSVS